MKPQYWSEARFAACQIVPRARGKRGWRGVGLLALVALTSGCMESVKGSAGPAPAADMVTQNAIGQGTAPGDVTAGYVLSGRYMNDWQSAFDFRTALGQLAVRANRLSFEQSPTKFELIAASEESAAEKAAWFPAVRPVASIGTNSATPVVGISLVQLIYDFGQTKTRREKAEITRALMEIEFWSERNAAVRDALKSFIDAVEASEILAARDSLEARLAALAAQEADRTTSGVSGQGDTLFLEVSRQENRRESIQQRSVLADARARLLRETGVPADQLAKLRFAAVTGTCKVPQSRDYAPNLLQARLAIELAGITVQEARSNLFPRIAAEAAVTTGANGSPEDNARLSLDGGSVAGGGARLRVSAAEQRKAAAAQGFVVAQSDFSRETERLELEISGLRSTLSEYSALVETTERSLALFEDRFAAGAASVSEAVRLEVERTANLVAIAATRGAIERNCIDAAALAGALSPANVNLR